MAGPEQDHEQYCLVDSCITGLTASTCEGGQDRGQWKQEDKRSIMTDKEAEYELGRDGRGERGLDRQGGEGECWGGCYTGGGRGGANSFPSYPHTASLC